MRIAIIGYGAESSTFSRHRIRLQDFDQRRGDDLLGIYDLAGWFPDDADVEWLPVLRAHAGSGGPIEPEAYAAIADEIVEGLRALGPLDGVYVDLHGASNVLGQLRAEERLLDRVREVVGDGAIISMSMDTHGNFSRQLAEAVDLAVCFRHAPHIDAMAIRERACRLLIETIRSGVRPRKAWVRVPLLLPGERTATNVEPGATAFGGIVPALERHGVVDASLWVGFAWADEDRNGGAAMVTGHDEAAILACAREVAELYWAPRREFAIVAPRSGSFDGALDLALERPEAPYFISDSGDNVTAGGSGDVTYALRAALAREDVAAAGLRLLFASCTDPGAVDAAIQAGEGSTLPRAIGAIVDDRHGDAVELDWHVVRLVDGLYDGEGVVGAVLRAPGTGDAVIDVIVKRTRTPFTDPDSTGLRHGRRLPGHVWIPLEGYDAVVVKNGYLFPDQQALSRTWYMALTPGGTDLDFDRLEFANVERPVWPLDTEFEADLTPVLLHDRGPVGAPAVASAS